MTAAPSGLAHGEPRVALVQGVVDAPPPPLAGALAAFLLRMGGGLRVLDPRGGAREPADGWPVWAHVDAGAAPWVPEDAGPVTLFGPGVDGDAGGRLAAEHPLWRVARGDPEAHLVLPFVPGIAHALADPSLLPLTTFAGFGAQPGGAFRLLAGRGPRARPVGAVVREILYLVETHGLGHVLFDDADLAALRTSTGRRFVDVLADELAHLPFRLTWSGP